MGATTVIIGLAFIVIGIVMISDGFSSPKDYSVLEGGFGIVFILFIGIGLLVASATSKKDQVVK